MSNPITSGVHHVGLSVKDVEKTALFFIEILGWKEVKRKNDYPAIFVSDGNNLITLWQINDNTPIEFDRKKNVGLHHLALRVKSLELLEELHLKIKSNNDFKIEFSPESLNGTNTIHMMCVDSNGIRIEFIVPENID